MLKIGDEVSYDIPGHDGAPGGRSFVIGFHHLGPDLLVLGDEAHSAMAINEGWCKPTGKADVWGALRWRERYLKNWPSALAPEFIQVSSRARRPRPSSTPTAAS